MAKEGILVWQSGFKQVFLAACGFLTFASAQIPSKYPNANTAGPTIDQSLELVTVKAPCISPDGLHLVYGQSRTNWNKNAFESDLWLVASSGRELRRLTAPNRSAFAPAWSPDGRWIAYLSDRPSVLPHSPENETQIYIAPAEGGEGVQLTEVATGIDQFQWSPDSKAIAFTSTDPGAQAEKDRKQTFGEYQIVHGTYAKSQLWLISVPKDAGIAHPNPEKLTNEAFTVNDFNFSPDGKLIAFAAQRDADPVSSTSSIYTVALAGHTVKNVVNTPGPNDAPFWSPDGQQIAFITSNADPHFLFSNRKIAVVPLNGSAEPTVVNPGFDEDASLVAWTRQGIYFTAFQHGMRRLFRLEASRQSVAAVSPAGEYVSGVDVSPNGRHFVFRGAVAGQMMEVLSAGLDANGLLTPMQVTHVNDQLGRWARSTREMVSWTSGDGTTIEGVLEKPADFRPGTKYPLLVIIHGGPTYNDTPVIEPDRTYPAELFLARGALILRPNYRGSTGYGARFRALNVRNLGVGDYADVLSGVDALIARGMVDPARVGAMGWSEGGFISAFITASSDRFVAVSVGAGISDWRTYYYGTDWTAFAKQYFEATPQSDPEVFTKASPITYIDRAKTPTLIQQSSMDPRVPVANSFELRQALEDRGVPVKMVLYENSGHMIENPKQQRAVMTENDLWFNHYLWGDPLPTDLTPANKAESETEFP